MLTLFTFIASQNSALFSNLFFVFVLFFTGIGLALLTVPAYSLLGQYFDKYLPLASGVVEVCGALGIVVFPPLTQILLDTYGWRNTLLLLGAVCLHMIISGILFRSPNTRRFSLLPTNDFFNDNKSTLGNNDLDYDTFSWMDLPSEGSSQTVKRKFDIFNLTGLHLFKNLSFLANCAATGSSSCIFTGWIIYFVPHCIAKGLSPREASLLASIAGFAYLIGCLVYIPIVSKQLISARGYIYISCAISSISLFADTFSSTFTTILVTNACFGFSFGSVYPLLIVCLKYVVNEGDLSKAFGWQVAVGGTFRILSGFLVGKC